MTLRTRSLVVPGLLIAAVIAITGGHVFTQNDKPADAFTFPEAAAGVAAPMKDAAKDTALKVRTAPVSASGEFTESLSIDVPPGRLGMTPSLSFDYSSGQAKRESPAGAGWSFGPAPISRSTLKGFPPLAVTNGVAIYDEAAAEFDSDSGRLVASPSATGTSRMYAPIRETSAVTFEYQSAGGRWIERAPNGVVRYYGADLFNHRARIVNELGTFAWLLLMEEDPDGNYISYEYHHIEDQDRQDKKSPQRTPVLSTVAWGGNRLTGLAPQFKASTRVVPYANGSLDMMQGNVYLASRLDTIAVGPFTPGAPAYWTYTLGVTASADSGRLLLKRFTRQAPNEPPRETTFDYSGNTTMTWAPGQPLPPALAEVYTEQSSQLGFLIDHSSVRNAVSPPHLRSAHHFMDFNGDGTTDVVYHPAGVSTTASEILDQFSFLKSTGPGWQPLPLSTLGFPPNRLYSTLTDVDGDYDVDALSFAVQVQMTDARHPTASGGFSVSTEMCSSEDFWNECGDIDPIRPDMMAGFLKAGGRIVDAMNPTGLAVFGGVVGSKSNPQILLVHPPKDWDGAAGKFPPVFDGSPVDGPDGKGGKGGKGLPGLDLRGGAINWSGGGAWPPGGGPGGGMKPVTSCLPRVKACMDLQTGPIWEGDKVPDVPPELRDAAAVVVAGSGYENYAATLADSCPQATATRMPLSITLNQSWNTPNPMPMQQTLEGWPQDLVHRVLIEVNPDSGPLSKYNAQIITDFLAPVTDINGDGLADIVLLKGMNSPLNSLPVYKFFPRAYISRPGGFVLDLAATGSPSQFTASLVEILNGGRFEECLNPGADETRRRYPYSMNFNAFLADLNGDGLPDLIVARPPTQPTADRQGQLHVGHDVHLNRGYKWERVDAVFDQWSAASDTAEPHSAPFLLLSNRGKGEPTGFNGTPFIEADPTLPSSTMAMVDVNGDGRQDVVFAFRSLQGGRTAIVYRNTGRGFVNDTSRFNLPPEFFMAGELPVTGNDQDRFKMVDMGRFVDMDNDGLPDAIRPGRLLQSNVLTSYSPPEWFRNLGVIPDLLTSVHAFSGAWTNVEYAAATSQAATAFVDGRMRPAGHVLVRKITRADGPVNSAAQAHTFSAETILLSYQNYTRDVQSSEAIGFETIVSDFSNALPLDGGWPGVGTPPIQCA